MLILQILFAAFVALLLVDCVKRYLLDRRPGPKGLPFVGHLPWDLMNLGENYQAWKSSLLPRYGTTMVRDLLLLKTVDIYDPQDVEYILKTNWQNFTQGAHRRGKFEELLGDGIFNADGDMWKFQRKTASHEFSVGRFRTFMMRVFVDHSERVVRVLDAAAASGQAIDVQNLMCRFTLDSICAIAFGEDLRSIEESGASARFAQAFDAANRLTFNRFPDITWQIKRFFNVGCEREYRRHIRVIDDFVWPLLDRKLALSDAALEEEANLLSRFILQTRSMGEGELPSGYSTRKWLRDIIINFLLAGRDTTAQALSWFIYELSKAPLVEERLLEEIDRVMGPLKGHATTLPTFEHIKALTYLHAAVTESLRLHPSVAEDGKTCEKDDVLPSGVPIFKGEAATYMPHGMGHAVHLWGPDAEVFRPERHLDTDGNFAAPSAYKFPVFQAGPRICLGKEMAYLEVKTLLAVLLPRFRLRVLPSPRVQWAMGLTVCMADGMRAQVEKRA